MVKIRPHFGCGVFCVLLTSEVYFNRWRKLALRIDETYLKNDAKKVPHFYVLIQKCGVFLGNFLLCRPATQFLH